MELYGFEGLEFSTSPPPSILVSSQAVPEPNDRVKIHFGHLVAVMA
jgi:hypothetical protein